MMKVPVRSLAGEVVGEVELKEEVFGVPLNGPVVHQALVRQLANARSGTAQTKTRGDVAGSTRKLYKQKGTGQARQGTRRAPHRRGSGVAFGPHPRSYRQAMPKKMRRLALRCLLSQKVAEEKLIVVEGLALEQPKTKRLVEVLEGLAVKSSALLAPPAPEANLKLAARNLEKVKTLPASLLNVVDLLNHDVLLTTVEGVHRMEELWTPRRRPAAALVEG